MNNLVVGPEIFVQLKEDRIHSKYSQGQILGQGFSLFFYDLDDYFIRRFRHCKPSYSEIHWFIQKFRKNIKKNNRNRPRYENFEEKRLDF